MLRRISGALISAFPLCSYFPEIVEGFLMRFWVTIDLRWTVGRHVGIGSFPSMVPIYRTLLSFLLSGMEEDTVAGVHTSHSSLHSPFRATDLLACVFLRICSSRMSSLSRVQSAAPFFCGLNAGVEVFYETCDSLLILHSWPLLESNHGV